MSELLPNNNTPEIGREYTDKDDELINNALNLLQTHFEFSAPGLAGISMILTPDKMPHEAIINRIASDWEDTSTEDCERKAFLFNAEEMFYPDGYPEVFKPEPYSTLRRAARNLCQQHRNLYNLRDGLTKQLGQRHSNDNRHFTSICLRNRNAASRTTRILRSMFL